MINSGQSPTAKAIADDAYGVKIDVVPLSFVQRDAQGNVVSGDLARYYGTPTGGTIEIPEEVVAVTEPLGLVIALIHEMTHAGDNRRKSIERQNESTEAKAQREDFAATKRRLLNTLPLEGHPDPLHEWAVSTETNAFVNEIQVSLEFSLPDTCPVIAQCVPTHAEKYEELKDSDYNGLFSARYPTDAPLSYRYDTPSIRPPVVMANGSVDNVSLWASPPPMGEAPPDSTCTDDTERCLEAGGGPQNLQQ